ncbi:uncharacterized protein LOC127104954 [Lathyrus oleraceus]|uniref:uncharacterized protein LOC127104954 n=1 Tax=Pisum sativum TaxID=3888 RepID=UPI0021D11BEB|nr:uncharacterized protein LOC127104954 [Pisum sativum]
MDLENCDCLGSRNNCIWSSYERIGNDPIVCVNEFMSKIKITRLKTLWRKIKRENKRRTFRSSSPTVFLYDPSSYLQNFDDGYSNDDDFSRSFSARFATPTSKILKKNIEVMYDEDIMETNDES